MNFKNFHISKELRKKLPDSEKDHIEKKLWDKTGGNCFLCEAKLDPENDYIVPDHDISENDNGKTTLENLNPAHRECNAFKQDNPSMDVRPYLKLKNKIENKSEGTQFDGVLELFNKKTRSVKVIQHKEFIDLDTGSGTEKLKIFKEKNQKFVYAEVPISVLINDKKCQPRNINLGHLWHIFKDIQKNPLHEAPTCRLDPLEKTTQKSLLLFDGQHKAAAFLLDRRETICVKIYLDLDEARANYLIGSIQSKIKKLPLSPFEFTLKMEKEWAKKWEDYSRANPDGSEKKFIASIQAADRKRARQAFSEALCAEIIDDESMILNQYIAKKRDKKDFAITILEQTFKNKIIFSLLKNEPLDDKLDVGAEKRELERKNIKKILNLFYQECFTPKDGKEFTENEKTKIKRMLYQGSLAYIAKMLKGLMSHIFRCELEDAFFQSQGIKTKWNDVTQGIRRLSNHPFWIAPRDQSQKVSDLNVALEKNQASPENFKRIGLDIGYLLSREDDPHWDT